MGSLCGMIAAMDMVDISKSTHDWMNWETEISKITYAGGIQPRAFAFGHKFPARKVVRPVGDSRRASKPGTGRKQKPRKDIVRVPSEAPSPRTRGNPNPVPPSSGPVAMPGRQDLARVPSRPNAPSSTSAYQSGPTYEIPGTGGPIGGEGANWGRSAAYGAGAAGATAAAGLGARAFLKHRGAKTAAAAAAEKAGLDAAKRRKQLLIGAGVGGAGLLGAGALAGSNR